ncbi:MAG: L,D-transpeptidase [Polyangiales bacterium]
MRRAFGVASFLVVFAEGAALRAPSALADDVAPLSPGTLSVEVVEDGAVVHVRPDASSPRRGTVTLGTRLAVTKRVAGAGCPSHGWYVVGEDAYVCSAFAVPSPLPPVGEDHAASLPGELLPLRVGIVRVDGTRRYAHPSDYGADEFVDTLGKNFAVVLGETREEDGIRFVRTRGGYWVESSTLDPPRPSAFEGVMLGADRALPLAWVTARKAAVYAAKSGAKVSRHASHREVLALGDEVTKDRIATAEGGFVRLRDVAVACTAPRPEGVGEHERWIDVDVSEQVLVAYEGDTPVFATLVSSGRPTAERATPLGQFRIWVKLASSDMDDLERTDVEENYFVEAVPWVQYFKDGVGFHTAFWHDDFGQARSHGCVNLSPKDAKWLFRFTGPNLPLGWHAVLPSGSETGTLVQVRSSRH